MAKKLVESVENETPPEESESKVEEEIKGLPAEVKEQIKAEIAAHLKDHPPVVIEDSDDDEEWRTLHEQDERIANLEKGKKKNKLSAGKAIEWLNIALMILVVPLGFGFLAWDYKNRNGRWPWQKTS